jgi:hypothetical protein
MRVAQIAPLAESVPPKLYGGTERVVSWLADELVALGHEVTLFASGDSRTKAKLVPAWPRALRLGRPRADPAAAYATLLQAVAEAAAGFDVIHSHVDWLPLPLLRRLRTPFLNTLHGRLDLPDVSLAMQTFGDAPFVSISQSQRAPLPGLNWLATIHHGMPADLLKLSEQPEGYLAFLGRITPEKGPDVAIRMAHGAGLPLRIAAKVPRGENRYFNETIKPLLDENNVRFVGEVNDRQKQAFLGNAAALLFPIDWPEPFGAGDDRGDGLRDARHRVAARIGTRSHRRRGHGLHRGLRSGGHRRDRPYPLPRPPSYSEEVRAALHRAADGARLRGQLSAADHAFPAQHQASPTWTPDQSRSSELIRGGPAPGSEAPPWFSSQRSMAANILSSFFRAIALASASTMSPVLRSLRVFSASSSRTNASSWSAGSLMPLRQRMWI